MECDREAARKWYGENFETNFNERGNVLTRQWGRMRGLMDRIRSNSGIKRDFRERQRGWLSDLGGQRVLDLGCGAGNNISIHMAQSAGFYLAFDLSAPAIAVLRGKLDENGLQQAQVRAGDFLDPQFPYEPFDVVYANSVLHAFHPLEDALEILFHRMTPGGRLVGMEPMETSWPVWAIRRTARLFRSDAAFNWPFSQRDFQTIQRYFEIEAVQGFYGWSKWAVPLGILPGAEGASTALVKRLHKWDKRDAARVGRGLWRCNSLTMLLRRREAVRSK